VMRRCLGVGSLWRIGSTTTLLGGSVAAIGLSRPSRQRILCESAPVLGAKGSAIDVHQLSVGSVAGLVTGYVIGKLSKVFVVLLGGVGLLLQFLSSRGIITLPSWRGMSSAIEKNAPDLESVRSQVLTNPSFKVAFLSTMIIGAMYS